MDPVLLARIQFAANISFHILFPSISIALGWVLLFFRWRFSSTGDEAWMAAYRFWVKVFALTFAVGVVSGVTMSFQFGTNWPGYMQRVGNIAGPLLAYEVLTAFFLEATFLSVMLFGINRVPGWMHMIATALVAGGTTLSAFWILALNSWMQTPAGFEIRDGVAHATDWWAVIFNPSMPYRVTHMLLASGLTVSFLVAGISAWRWLQGDPAPEVRKGLVTGIRLAAVLIPIQIFVGDQHGLNTLRHQPAKIAALEAIWDTETGPPLVLFAIPDEATRSNRYEIAVPHLGSLILTHEWNGTVRGMNDFPEHPSPIIPFFAFRVMVGVGVIMLIVSWWGALATRRARPPGRWLARALVAMTFSGWVAVLAGWYVTETGRQPWLVTGVLRTAEAAGPVHAHNIATSLAMYVILYLALLGAYIGTLFFMSRRPGPTRPGIDEQLPQVAE